MHVSRQGRKEGGNQCPCGSCRAGKQCSISILHLLLRERPVSERLISRAFPACRGVSSPCTNTEILHSSFSCDTCLWNACLPFMPSELCGMQQESHTLMFFVAGLTSLPHQLMSLARPSLAPAEPCVAEAGLPAAFATEHCWDHYEDVEPSRTMHTSQGTEMSVSRVRFPPADLS